MILIQLIRCKYLLLQPLCRFAYVAGRVAPTCVPREDVTSPEGLNISRDPAKTF